MLLTPASLQALQTGFHGFYRNAYGSTPNFGDRIAMTVPSNTDLETYGWMESLAPLREWIGPRQINNFRTAVYTLRNKKFELTYGVSRDEIEDDRLGLYNAKFSGMGFQAKKWPDQLIKAALQAGTTGNQWDGVPFFSTAHPLNPAGNQSNNFTSTALNAANFGSTRAAMIGYTDSNGENLGVDPRLLVVPPQLEIAAREIVSIPNLAGGATNPYYGLAEVLVIRELANQATTWYLMDVSTPIKPLVFQLRDAPQFSSLTDINSEMVFKQDMFVWGVRARGAVGYGLWFLAARAIA